MASLSTSPVVLVKGAPRNPFHSPGPKPQDLEYGRPSLELARLSFEQRPSFELGRPSFDRGRPSFEYGRPSFERGRRSIDSMQLPPGGKPQSMADEPASNGKAVTGRNKEKKPKRPTASFLEKVKFGTHIWTLRAFLAGPLYYRDWKEYFTPPEVRPDIVKSYECRSHLPVRIFFPKSYDQTSSKTLPTLISIHGGGFCIGTARDDDDYNRAFADHHDLLVISLEYSKAPWCPFPTAQHDIEAVYTAILADESLPIARAASSPNGKSRIAVLGFSSGGNLALTLGQLPSIKGTPNAPSAAISVYGALDLSRKPLDKTRNRFYKPALPPPRGHRWDSLAFMAPAFEWSYIPYGHDLTDPLLSPAFAKQADLTPHVYIIAAELDMLGHESWRMACRLANEGNTSHGRPANREVPDPDSKADKVKCVGKRASSKKKGELVLDDDDRYFWEETWKDGSVNWLLVPDVVHGFDNKNIRELGGGGGEETIRDAEAKTEAYQKKVAEWLFNVVWK